MLATVVLMSLPWLVPHMGWTALFGLVPLLIMERLATSGGSKHFFWWHYGTFVLWNAVTTWWVCEATVGGGIFAVLANALQMSVVFGSFRLVKKRLSGALPYIYLAAAWIAWERFYLTSAQISWPWLVLGNAFADTTGLVQWYSVLGHTGGSLWVWLCNLSIFGLMVAFSDGRFSSWNLKARAAAIFGAVLALFGPMARSWSISSREFTGEPLRVVIGQPNFDPYQKFEFLTQAQQDARYLKLLEEATPIDELVLILAPETFTSRVFTDDIESHETYRRFQGFLSGHPLASVIYGASSYEKVYSFSSPDPCAYDMGLQSGGSHLWILMHNSAISVDTSGVTGLYHKSKLVVGTELTPYPKFFIPFQKLLLGETVMAQDVGQKRISCLPIVTYGDSLGLRPRNDKKEVAGSVMPGIDNSVMPGIDRAYPVIPSEASVSPIGTAVCYESVYGEFCTGYVREGARLLAVITNDAWWGNTPGYRQHLNYSRLRAIECGRYVARCANTGISAIIDPHGRILSHTSWWQPAVLDGTVQLLDGQTFFVRYGDITGRISVLLFLLLALVALVPRHR